MLHRTSSLLLAGLIASLSGPAWAAPPSPRPWLEGQVEAARKLSQKQVKANTPEAKALEKEARALINATLNWDEMIQRSLGSQWKKRTKEEQQEFSKLLKEMIESSIESKLRMAGKNGDDKKRPKKVKIDWQEEEVNGTKAKLAANVKADKTKAFMEFKLLYQKDRWRVWDVIIDDVSTVRTYRSQFRKLISDKGFDGLLARMRSKIKDIREGRADLAP